MYMLLPKKQLKAEILVRIQVNYLAKNNHGINRVVSSDGNGQQMIVVKLNIC